MAASCYGLAISGVTNLADGWASALGVATKRNGLHLHTLVPLRDVVPPAKLLSPTERFCSICYADDERSNRPKYNRLLWSIDYVTACPMHGVQLKPVEKAKHASGNAFWLPGRAKRANASTFWLPGISRIDGQSLASDTGIAAREDEIEFARLTADLIDDLHQHPHAFENIGAPAIFLRYATDVLFAGNSAHFARHIGVSKSGLHEWASGKVRPSLPRLALIAYCCGCAIADVILGNKVMLFKRQPPVRPGNLIVRRRKGSLRPRHELHVEFEQLVESGQASCAREAADCLDVSTKFLRTLSPTLHKELVRAGKERSQRAVEEREKSKFDEFRKSFDLIVHRLERPTRRKVENDVFERTGMTFGFKESGRFLKRAHELAHVDGPTATVGRRGGRLETRNRPSMDVYL